MIGIGLKIYKAVLRSKPILLDGSQIISKQSRFSLKNPYILEALSGKEIQQLANLEGKKLNTVCRILDSPDAPVILQRYNKLFSKTGFSDSELNLLLKKAFNGGKAPSPTSGNLDAMVYLNSLSGSVGSKFDAHGLAKVSIPDQLYQLNTILTKGIDKTRKFYTAPLAVADDVIAGAGAGLGTSGGCALRDGSFILTSGKGKSIINDGIENVIVNDAYYNIIEDLRLRFPNVNFIKASEAVKYFEKL